MAHVNRCGVQIRNLQHRIAATLGFHGRLGDLGERLDRCGPLALGVDLELPGGGPLEVHRPNALVGEETAGEVGDVVPFSGVTRGLKQPAVIVGEADDGRRRIGDLDFDGLATGACEFDRVPGFRFLTRAAGGCRLLRSTPFGTVPFSRCRRVRGWTVSAGVTAEVAAAEHSDEGEGEGACCGSAARFYAHLEMLPMSTDVAVPAAPRAAPVMRPRSCSRSGEGRAQATVTRTRTARTRSRRGE